MLEQPTKENATEGSEATPQRILTDAAISVSWLFVVACVHLMYVGFVLYGSKARTVTVLDTLNEGGRQSYLPEREIPIYLIGCVLTLGLSLAAAIFWNRTARARNEADPGFAVRSCLLNLVLAAVSCGLNLSCQLGIKSIGMHFGFPINEIALVMVVPALVETAVFALSQRQRSSGWMRAQFASLDSDLKAVVDRIGLASSSGTTTRERSRSQQTLYRTIDVCVVIFICAVIYVPRTDLLAGQDYMFQHFHHWDHFAIGPAIGLVKGLHLATQVYCQYGFGWPLLLAKLDPVFRLSYGHAYKVAVIYGCLYYCGLYWLLRRLLTHPAWAIAGIMLALRLQVFHGGELDIPIWFVPSASILRTPCDVWVLLLLLQHWRSQRPLWLMMAGALVGASLLFVIDTGVYLTLVFAGYNILWIVSSSASATLDAEEPRCELSDAANSGTIWRRIRLSVASFVVAGLVLLSGLIAASGSSVFSPGYLHHWLEVLWLYPSGIMMLPMTVETIGIMYSYWIILLFLAHICAGTIRFRSGIRRAEESIVPCIAMLGLLYLIYYIGNSHAYSINQLSTPFCIIAVYTAARMAAGLREYSRGLQTSHESAVAIAAAAVVTVVLLLNPQLRGYPSLMMSVFRPPASDIVCFFADTQDVCVPAKLHPNTTPFQLVAAEMRRLTDQGKSIAVIANDDTSLYVASRATLWNRYTPLLPPLVTKSQLAEVDRELSMRPVDYVFLKQKDPSLDGFWTGMYPLKTTDCWIVLSNTTRRLYYYDHDCGAYEVWRK